MEKYEIKIKKFLITSRIADHLNNFLMFGWEPGPMFISILTGNLDQAIDRASPIVIDDHLFYGNDDQKNLCHSDVEYSKRFHAVYVYLLVKDMMPTVCYGSREKYCKWVNHQGLRGAKLADKVAFKLEAHEFWIETNKIILNEWGIL